MGLGPINKSPGPEIPKKGCLMRWCVLILAVCLASCAALGNRLALGPELVGAAGWHWEILSSGVFDLAVAFPPGQSGDVLTVYVEGDGFAFVHPRQPSMDPTPTDPVALRLALAQPKFGGAVAWLGRPCQYTLPGHGRNCDARYWTNGRYAAEVIASLGLALDALKARTTASRLILVGYSGGGAAATLLAAHRRDVVGIITVAADLDLAYWTQRDGLSPLAGSLDPAAFAAQLGALPQYHFTGQQDMVVGTDVARSYFRRLPPLNNSTVQEIPGFNHTCCWVSAWPGLFEHARQALDRHS